MRLDPLQRFRELMTRAVAAEPFDPTTVALATAGKDGVPHVRIVLLKGVDDRGFVFFTNKTSQKGHDLFENPRASLCFYYPTLSEQARITGDVEQVSEAESDAYFATRPRGSQIGAWASLQSAALPTREDLLARVGQYEGEFDGRAVTRPPHWGGYRVVPWAIEFWKGMESRLHERTLFERVGSEWRTKMLYP